METWNQTAADPVRTHTPQRVNQSIDARVEACVRAMADKGRGEISAYLTRLEGEWDVERAAMVGGAALTLLGLVGRSRFGLRRLLGTLGAALLIQQGTVGFGPLASLARALGVRTRAEIDCEKYALKALRGDFQRIPHEGGPLARANAALVAAQS